MDHPLRLWRKQNNKTLQEVADGVECSAATISRVENGDGLSEDLMRRIAAFTENAVTPNDLLGIEAQGQSSGHGAERVAS